ncbi:hypothetical protein J6590_029242 [Homalodisca vitripennis]|nr:hypothetical protein J6590_029242 [Homalodisca vitripennis]
MSPWKKESLDLISTQRGHGTGVSPSGVVPVSVRTARNDGRPVRPEFPDARARHGTLRWDEREVNVSSQIVSLHRDALDRLITADTYRSLRAVNKHIGGFPIDRM